MDALGGAGGVQPVPVPQTPKQPLKEASRVRSVFPETWLWSNATIGYMIDL